MSIARFQPLRLPYASSYGWLTKSSTRVVSVGHFGGRGISMPRNFINDANEEPTNQRKTVLLLASLASWSQPPLIGFAGERGSHSLVLIRDRGRLPSHSLISQKVLLFQGGCQDSSMLRFAITSQHYALDTSPTTEFPACGPYLRFSSYHPSTGYTVCGPTRNCYRGNRRCFHIVDWWGTRHGMYIHLATPVPLPDCV